MVARIWSARATPANWPAYESHFAEGVLPQLRAIDGYVSANLLKREADGQIEITVWRSPEAIDSFAGPDRETAVVAPNAAALLIDYDRRVRHYEVAISDAKAGGGAAA
jgi:heme-degrading monooxygenase HmoA